MIGVSEELIRDIDELNGRFTINFIRELNRLNPLDTGLSRSGWFASASQETSRQLPITTPAATVSAAVRFALSRDLVTRPFYILNNVEYIEPLLDGHSPQASRGWMDRTLVNELNSVYGGN